MRFRSQERRLPRLVATLALLALTSTAAYSQREPVYAENRRSADGVTIHYDLTIGEPNRHLYRIELTVAGIDDGLIRVSMPAWSPGAYRIEDYARNVQAFTARTDDGRSLEWQKTGKQTWQIVKDPDDNVVIAYEVYSQNLTPEMADLAGPETYMYVEGHKHVPVAVDYHVPPSWRVYTGLSGEEGHFTAPDYDIFIDAPAFIGEARVVEFLYEGERYRLVFSDPDIRFDEGQVTSDIRAIVEAAVDLFGSTPFDDYTFLFRVTGGQGSGGLEHLNSTRITVGRDGLTDRDRYERFLYVVAHEFFHVWNVKWIRPEGLGPFDYEREVHTRLLWVSEGITSYYGRLLLVRAGIISETDYFEALGAQIGSFQENPGRALMSNEEASWNTWLTSDNAANNSISYYVKGEIAGLLLDLELRARSGNSRSLDDVMRYLMVNWAERGIGVPESGFLDALEDVSGTEFDDIYAELASGRGEPDYNRFLLHAGLALSSEARSDNVYMGVRLEEAADERARIVSVIDGGPAQRAGLDRGDVLLSFDGRSITMDTLTSELGSYSPGDVVNVVFRRDRREMEVPLIPVADPQRSWIVAPVDDAAEAQLAIRDTWLTGRAD